MLSDEEIMRQVLEAFQEEQTEHRQAIANILLELEHDADNPQRETLLTQLFREAHSLKGGARAAGIEAVEQMAHCMEDLFSAVRAGTLHLTPDVCDPVYAALESIGEMMGQVAAGQEADLQPHQQVLDNLACCLEQAQAAPAAPHEPPARPATPVQKPTVAPAPPAEAEEPPAVPVPAEQDAEIVAAAGQSPVTAAARPAAVEEIPWESANTTVRLSINTLDSLMSETGELITSAVRAQQRARDARALIDIPARWRRIWRQINPIINRIRKQQPELHPTVHHLHDRERIIRLSEAESSSVSLVQYDTVMLLEALIAANTLLNDLETHLAEHARGTGEDSARLSAVTNRLQDQIRRTRMLPLTTLFSPMRVQLREMMRVAGKQIILEIDDGGAEADRQVLESLREVLLHLLRNAVDHGIEPAETRVAHGKPPQGRVSLHAVVSGDYLDLSVEDDGAGLDVEAIKQRALLQGLLNEMDMSRSSEADIVDLIFLPGFSTRHKVDKLSGRGVGLDVVRSQVERMHGQVSVHTMAGEGCVFAIRVPLSLTSSHGLLLKVGQGTYMLPLESVQRIVPVSPRDIRMIEGQTALVLDDHAITLIHLADLLSETKQLKLGSEHGAGRGSAQPASTAGQRSLALLLGSGERQVACLVDAILGEQELVVHRLPAPLQRVRFVAGATVLADGKVVPILDLVDVLRSAIGARGMISITPEMAGQQAVPTILVVDDSITTRTLEKNILEAAGYQVQLAIDGAEAMHVLHRMIENGGCDLLLSDIDMPNLNGFDLTSQVRSDPQLKHLPIVLMTSLDTPADRERGLSAGADAYIVKRAFDQQSLLDTISHLI